MKKEKQLSLIKRLTLVETALLISTATIVSGTPLKTEAKRVSKTMPVKTKLTKEVIQKEVVPSIKQYETMIVAKEEVSEVKRENIQVEEQNRFKEITFESGSMEPLEESYVSTFEEEQEAYATLDFEAQDFNCPKDETDEERAARLKAKEEQRQKEIKEEENRYQEYLKSFYEPLLKTYAKYYHLDGTKVVAIAKKLTKNYTIDLSKFTNTTYDALGTIESKVMFFVSGLNDDRLTVKLGSLGYSKKSLITSQTIETIKPNLILSNGQSYSQFFGKICDMMGIDKTTALAISFHETGRVTNYQSRNKNNFGGLSGGTSFCTPEAGIIGYVRYLKGLEKEGFKLNSSRDNLIRLSCYYVNGTYTIPSYSWVDCVSSFIREITRDKNKYFPTSKTNMTGNSYMMSSVEKTFGASPKIYTKK